MKRSSILFLVAAVLFGPIGCDTGNAVGPENPEKLEFAAFLDVDLSEMSVSPLGVWYKDLVTGAGAEVNAGETVTVHYEGWLHDGTKFDSSVDRGEPATFSLNQVIIGWQDGVPGMKVGGKRKLVIPSNLAYGSQGTSNGVIPSYATLVFNIELLGIEAG